MLKTSGRYSVIPIEHDRINKEKIECSRERITARIAAAAIVASFYLSSLHQGTICETLGKVKFQFDQSRSMTILCDESFAYR